MKTKTKPVFLPVVFLICIHVACSKSITELPTLQTNPSEITDHRVPYPQTFVTGCSYSPDYGDTIIFPQPANEQDYIIVPVNNPGNGRYFSWPEGMVIDSVTGAINITKSATGLKYAIGFVKQGTVDTCLQTLTIAGLSYMDSVYVLADNHTTAAPYFNANPGLASPKSGSKFDITNSSLNKNIPVNKNYGTINLKQALNSGGFGPMPYDGQIVNIDLYYTLNDASNNAVQHIPVQLIYYRNKSSIGTALLSTIHSKLNNILTGNLITKNPNPRPPIVIITRYN